MEVGASVYRNGTFSHNSSGNWLEVGMDTEVFDTDAFHDNVTNNSRLTVPSGKAGKYVVVGAVWWDTNATGDRFIRLLKNGSTELVLFEAAAQGGGPRHNISCIVDLAVGDYVELGAWQNSGGTRTLGDATNDAALFLQMMRVGNTGDQKISALSALTSLAGTEEFVVNDAGTSKKITAANLATDIAADIGLWTVVTKASDESVTSSTTLQDDNELQYTVVAGASYYFSLELAHNGASTGDFKWAFALSTGSFTRGWRKVIGYYNTTTVTAAEGLVNDMTTAVTAGASATENLVQNISGFFIPSANATLKLQWAQNTSDGTATIVKAGSRLLIRRVV